MRTALYLMRMASVSLFEAPQILINFKTLWYFRVQDGKNQLVALAKWSNLATLQFSALNFWTTLQWKLHSTTMLCFTVQCSSSLNCLWFRYFDCTAFNCNVIKLLNKCTSVWSVGTFWPVSGTVTFSIMHDCCALQCIVMHAEIVCGCLTLLQLVPSDLSDAQA